MSNTNSNPYSKVGDANESSAFLTNQDGYDVAILHRVFKNQVEEDAQILNDDQWQETIDLIHAAPGLLAVVKRFISLCPSPEGLGGHAPIGAFSIAADEARQILAKANIK